MTLTVCICYDLQILFIIVQQVFKDLGNNNEQGDIIKLLIPIQNNIYSEFYDIEFKKKVLFA